MIFSIKICINTRAYISWEEEAHALTSFCFMRHTPLPLTDLLYPRPQHFTIFRSIHIKEFPAESAKWRALPNCGADVNLSVYLLTYRSEEESTYHCVYLRVSREGVTRGTKGERGYLSLCVLTCE